MNHHTPYWLGLSLVSGFGALRIQRLIAQFGTAEAAWKASPADLRVIGMSETLLQAFERTRKKISLPEEISKVAKANASIITLDDEDYPALLRQISTPPPVLYIRGTLIAADDSAFAIVGTRTASPYGRDATFKIARQLASAGLTIVSGLADGIDTAAHRGALAGGGRTIGVLGCGIERMYPSKSTALVQDILAKERGVILSEFPIGMPPHKLNFPRRNRIISGLALGVLVAEAPEGSGSLLTATHASEQGRDVFAIPASIFSPNSVGTNKLIQDGAKLVMTHDDILSEIPLTRKLPPVRQQPAPSAQPLVPADADMPLSDSERTLMQLLTDTPVHIDDLIRTSALRADTVISSMTLLELKGLAEMTGSMQYCRSQ